MAGIIRQALPYSEGHRFHSLRHFSFSLVILHLRPNALHSPPRKRAWQILLATS